MVHFTTGYVRLIMRTKAGYLFSLALGIAAFGFFIANRASAQNAEKTTSSVAQEKKAPVVMVTFTWSFGNIGDIGITPGMINLIRDHFPNSEIILVANSYQENVVDYFTNNFSNVSVIPTPFINDVKTPISRDVFKAIQDDPSLDQAYGTPYEKRAKVFREAFDRSDFILFNSGTVLSYGRWKYSMSSTLHFWWPLILAQKHGKHYGIYSHSFERFAWPANELLVPVLNDADFVFCRDGNSLQYLKDSGVTTKILEYGPDATFNFTPTKKASGYQEFMSKHGLKEHEYITLTIRSGRSNQGFIEPHSARENLHAKKLRELVTRYIEETGNKVLIAPEVKSEIIPAKELIYDQLPKNVLDKVILMEEFWLPDLAYSVYESAETVVTMEAHSMIMALAVGTPILHPRFIEAGRKAWMLKDLGLEEWLFDLDEKSDSVDKMYKELISIHKDYATAKAKVSKALKYVKEREKRTMDVFEASVNQAIGQ